jgi:hypothetical protein
MEDQHSPQNVDGTGGPVQEPQANYNPPQSQYSPPPSYQPPPQQYQPPQSRSGGGPFDMISNPIRFYSAERIPKLIALGIMFMLIGAILIVLVTTSGGPNRLDDKYDGNGDLWDQDNLIYDTVKDIGVTIGKILFNIGMFFLILALVIGGLVNQNLEKHVRIALIIAGAFIFAWVGLMF